jgi:DnaA-homolog protein
MNAERKRQLALRFPTQLRCTLENFEVGPNGELVEHLRRCGRTGAFSASWLIGDSGSGKSHLLHGTCQAADVRGAAAAYLPESLRRGGTGVLDGIDEFDVVAIDDVHHWIGERRWEEALLGLYQGLAARGGALLCASTRSPNDLDFALADLASRLRAAQVFVIGSLDDVDRANAIDRLASERGLDIAPDVVSFVLRRAPRRMDELVAALDRLDRAAWAQQRRVTIPLVKDVLGL